MGRTSRVKGAGGAARRAPPDPSVRKKANQRARQYSERRTQSDIATSRHHFAAFLAEFFSWMPLSSTRISISSRALGVNCQGSFKSFKIKALNVSFLGTRS